MRQPTDELVMDLDEPLRQDIIRAIGITKLQYEPTIGQRFLVGTTNGTMVNVRRKVASPINKLALRFKCHVGPVITIDRNPFVMKYFLTVGDWTVKIWTEDIKESSLISLRLDPLNLNDLNRPALRIKAINLKKNPFKLEITWIKCIVEFLICFIFALVYIHYVY